MKEEININGSTDKEGNFIWGGALTLAWKKLSQDIVNEPIKLNTKNKHALVISKNFTDSPFEEKMLDESCYYAKAGFGNATVKTINKEVKSKFPKKSTAKLEENLEDSSIIAYAYFLKDLKFEKPFFPSEVFFNGQKKQGFKAENAAQKKQISVYNYEDKDNFIISLDTTSEIDTIFIHKSSKKLSPEEAIESVNEIEQEGRLHSDDIFEMPKVSLKHKRNLQELSGIKLANKNFELYEFKEVFEIINLDITESGVKVENEGVIKMSKCKKVHKEIRRFVLDSDFWIVMKEGNKYPYFVAHISSL